MGYGINRVVTIVKLILIHYQYVNIYFYNYPIICYHFLLTSLIIFVLIKFLIVICKARLVLKQMIVWFWFLERMLVEVGNSKLPVMTL